MGRLATESQLLMSTPAGYEKPPNQFIFQALGVDREKKRAFGVCATQPIRGTARREPGLVADKSPVVTLTEKQTMCHRSNILK